MCRHALGGLFYMFYACFRRPVLRLFYACFRRRVLHVCSRHAFGGVFYMSVLGVL